MNSWCFSNAIIVPLWVYGSNKNCGLTQRYSGQEKPKLNGKTHHLLEKKLWHVSWRAANTEKQLFQGKGLAKIILLPRCRFKTYKTQIQMLLKNRRVWNKTSHYDSKNRLMMNLIWAAVAANKKLCNLSGGCCLLSWADGIRCDYIVSKESIHRFTFSDWGLYVSASIQQELCVYGCGKLYKFFYEV